MIDMRFKPPWTRLSVQPSAPSLDGVRLHLEEAVMTFRLTSATIEEELRLLEEEREEEESLDDTRKGDSGA